MKDSPSNILCFLDLETTGHDTVARVENMLVPWHEIIDVGAMFVCSSSLKVYKEIDVKVKPEHPERCLPNIINDYPERCKNGEWNDAIALDNALHYFLDSCKDFDKTVILTGQNFFFDWSFMTVAFAWCGILESEWSKVLHYSRLDTRSMAVQQFLEAGENYDPSQYSLRNSFLSSRLGIPAEPHPHKALNGARQAYLVYKRLRELKQ